MCLAVPGKVMEIRDEALFSMTGKVDFGGILKEVNLSYVPEVKIGEYVIVHVGFAISIVDEDEAKKVFQYLKEIDELSEVE
ncbi:MAG: hydrogenase assembly protein HupF [Candidatus Omnitrophica bacterium CG1_02_46_14]|nr:MAG: hydrogenase assembly protein HupF [Candidatus Omnitrophica bacterium CG1_02_46_14]